MWSKAFAALRKNALATRWPPSRRRLRHGNEEPWQPDATEV